MSAQLHPMMFAALATCAAIASLFFVRYWRLTRDRLFGFFAFAFGALAANWIALGAYAPQSEHRDFAFVIRLIAFVAILAGILDKNRRT
jgi:hypothetical protein